MSEINTIEEDKPLPLKPTTPLSSSAEGNPETVPGSHLKQHPLSNPSSFPPGAPIIPPPIISSTPPSSTPPLANSGNSSGTQNFQNSQNTHNNKSPIISAIPAQAQFKPPLSASLSASEKVLLFQGVEELNRLRSNGELLSSIQSAPDPVLNYLLDLGKTVKNRDQDFSNHISQSTNMPSPSLDIPFINSTKKMDYMSSSASFAPLSVGYKNPFEPNDLVLDSSHITHNQPPSKNASQKLTKIDPVDIFHPPIRPEPKESKAPFRTTTNKKDIQSTTPIDELSYYPGPTKTGELKQSSSNIPQDKFSHLFPKASVSVSKPDDKLDIFAKESVLVSKPLDDKLFYTKEKGTKPLDDKLFIPKEKITKLGEEKYIMKDKIPKPIEDKLFFPQEKLTPPITVKIPTEREPSILPTVKAVQKQVVFRTKCKTHWGQQVLVVGNLSTLGNWNIDKAIPLQYIDDFYWKSDPVLVDSVFEYKYVIEEPGTYIWEPNPNRKVKIEVDTVISEDFGTIDNIIFEPLSLPKGEKSSIQLKVFCKTSLGEEVCLVGDSTQAGNWDIRFGIPLKYANNYWWKSPELYFESNLEYKYVRVLKNKSVIWEDMPNRKLTSPPETSIVVNESFNQPILRKIVNTSNPNLNVMTFNIRVDVAEDPHLWTDRRHVISRIIARKNPQIIGIQEPEHHQLQDLLRLNPGYKHVGVGRSGGNSGEYSAILYDTRRFELIDTETFWLSPTPHTVSQGWGAACLRICSWIILSDKLSLNPETALIMMFNTHLDHVSAIARTEGMALVLEKIREHTGIPIILTGDFNVTPQDPVIKMIKKELNLTSEKADRKLHENYGTFTGWDPKPNNQTIDYIFVNNFFSIRTYEVITEFDNEPTLASDHRPVFCKLRIK